MKAEYLTAEGMAQRTGRSVRFFRRVAASVPWAHQPCGPKTPWHFHFEGYEKWLRRKPTRNRKTASTSAARSGGACSGSRRRAEAVGDGADRLKQKLKAWPAKTSHEEEKRLVAAALRQGQIAVNSMLRDWVKGQLTAVECGLISFEAVFMPHMLTSDGRTLLERVQEAKMLPPSSG